MDGYFGSINSENPAETIEFTATADGMAKVVLASSFGDAHTSLSVADSQHDVIEMQTEGLDGFDVLSFEVEAGETYQLTVTSDDANCEGQFQVTVGFEAHVDQHADQMGSESTELQWIDNTAELSGRLESAGDTDTFRFTATTDGEVTLELQETVDDARIRLGVSIQDSQGNLLAEGVTNEMLQVSFDVVDGQEYFVAVSAGEGQTGTYNIGLELEASPDLSPDQFADCDVVDDTIDSEVSEPGIAETEIPESELVRDQTTESEVVTDPVAPSDCELVENSGAVLNPDGAHIEGEPTNEIADESADQQLCDQQPVGPQPGSELLASTEAPAVDDLPNAWVDCGGVESLVSGDNSATGFEPGINLNQEIAAGELILSAGDELAQIDEALDEPIASFTEQDAVDNFFADLGDEIEFHFDFSFSRHHSILV